MLAFISSLLITAFAIFAPVIMIACLALGIWLACRHLLWPGLARLGRGMIWACLFSQELARQPKSLFNFIFLTAPACLGIGLLFVIALPVFIVLAVPYYLLLALCGSANDPLAQFLFQAAERLQAKARPHPSQ